MLGLAVWIEEVTCLPLHAMLHFTGQLEKQPVCQFSDARVYSGLFSYISPLFWFQMTDVKSC